MHFILPPIPKSVTIFSLQIQKNPREREREGRRRRRRRIPAVLDWEDSGFPDGDLLEGGDGHDEVGIRGIAEPSGVGGEAVIRRAEIGSGEDDGGSRDAVAELLHASDLVASTARQALLEERGAQAGGGQAVAALPQIAVAAGSSCDGGGSEIRLERNTMGELGRKRVRTDGVPWIGGGVVGSAGGAPLGESGGGERRRGAVSSGEVEEG